MKLLKERKLMWKTGASLAKFADGEKKKTLFHNDESSFSKFFIFKYSLDKTVSKKM